MSHPYIRLFPGKTAAPTVDDDVSLGYEVGDNWIRTNGEIYQCTNATDGAAVWVNLTAGGSGHTIKDEGTPLAARAGLNFTGAGVTVTDDAGNNETDVVIPGGVSFNDAEGDPAATGATADGTSTYASRRDHVHSVGLHAHSGGLNGGQVDAIDVIYTALDDIVSANAQDAIDEVAAKRVKKSAFQGYHWLPFGVYIGSNPFSANSSPYSAGVDQNFTLKSLAVAVYASAPNDGSNYWTISLVRWYDVALYGSVDTSGISAGYARLSTTTFSDASVTTSDMGIVLTVSKTGNPGALYISGPAVQIQV